GPRRRCERAGPRRPAHGTHGRCAQGPQRRDPIARGSRRGPLAARHRQPRHRARARGRVVAGDRLRGRPRARRRAVGDPASGDLRIPPQAHEGARTGRAARGAHARLDLHHADLPAVAGALRRGPSIREGPLARSHGMRYLPLLWAALWRSPLEALLTWLAATVAFILFGLMVGLYVHTQRTIEAQRMDRLYVVVRYPGT